VKILTGRWGPGYLHQEWSTTPARWSRAAIFHSTTTPGGLYQCTNHGSVVVQFLSSRPSSIDHFREMALVLPPWFGRGCGRRTRPFGFGSPSLFTDLVIIKVPQMAQRQASAQERSPAMSNARVVQWSETADSNIFKLRLPGIYIYVSIELFDSRFNYIFVKSLSIS
jgi:hypothetical protein